MHVCNFSLQETLYLHEPDRDFKVVILSCCCPIELHEVSIQRSSWLAYPLFVRFLQELHVSACVCLSLQLVMIVRVSNENLIFILL